MPELSHKGSVSLWGPCLDGSAFVLEHAVARERLLLPPGGTWVLSFTERGYGYVSCVSDEGDMVSNRFCCDLFKVSVRQADGSNDWWLQSLPMGPLLPRGARTKHDVCYPQFHVHYDGPRQVVPWKAYRLLLLGHGARVFLEDGVLTKYLVDAQPEPTDRKPHKLLDSGRTKWKRHVEMLGLGGHMLRGTKSHGPGRAAGPEERMCLPWSGSSCYVLIYALPLFAAAAMTCNGLRAGQAARRLLTACVVKCISSGFTAAVLLHPEASGEPGLGVTAASWPSAPTVEVDRAESGIVDLSGLDRALGPCAARVVALSRRCGYHTLRLHLTCLLTLLLAEGSFFAWLASQLHNWLGMLLEATILAECSQQDASVADAPGVAPGQMEDHELQEAPSLASKQFKAMVKPGKCRFVLHPQKCMKKVLLKYTMACRQVCTQVGECWHCCGRIQAGRQGYTARGDPAHGLQESILHAAPGPRHSAPNQGHKGSWVMFRFEDPHFLHTACSHF